MAHTGKSYRLAFRRDLGFHVANNRNSWPFACVPVLNNAFGSIANQCRGKPWLIEMHFDGSGSLSGESNHLLVGTDAVYCRIEGTPNTAVVAKYTVSMKWFKEPAVLLYNRTVLDSPVTVYFSFGADRDNGVVFETPGVFQSDPSSPAFDGFVAKGWH